MDVITAFWEALAVETAGPGADPALLPQHLTCAASAVLDVDGVGLSVHSQRGQRTPLAASNAGAGDAERIQFTVGSGPCLLAAAVELPIFATDELIARRWPAFHETLGRATPIRSILALPLPGRLRRVAVLDLYFTDPYGAISIDIEQARLVVRLVAEELDRAAHWAQSDDTGVPDWWDTPAASERGRLWVAVGMVTAALHVSASDALALLRAHAYGSDRTVDDLAADVVNRQVTLNDLGVDDLGGR